MKLIDNWRYILRKAWSVRLIVLSAVLSVAETLVSFADTSSDPAFVVEPITGLHVPRGLFAMVAAGLSVAALTVRVLAQKELTPDD